MIRRTILVVALAAVYFAFKRSQARRQAAGADHDAEAQWANEGGANAPPSL